MGATLLYGVDGTPKVFALGAEGQSFLSTFFSAREWRASSVRSAAACHSNGLRSGLLSSLVAKMPTPTRNKRRVKGFASRGESATYLGVATDHVIESFRNRLWADYKTGAGIEPAL